MEKRKNNMLTNGSFLKLAKFVEENLTQLNQLTCEEEAKLATNKLEFIVTTNNIMHVRQAMGTPRRIRTAAHKKRMCASKKIRQLSRILLNLHIQLGEEAPQSLYSLAEKNGDDE